MRKYLLSLLAVISLFTLTGMITVNASDEITMYRLYNANSGEHFYTASAYEKDHLASIGWNYEGVGWTAPSTGDPVYRVYNPNSGDHHYTLSEYEKNYLVSIGWNDEGIGWYSASASNGLPLYRQYNPYARTGNHNYTLSAYEKNHLVSIGWNDEGIGWYGVDVNATSCVPAWDETVVDSAAWTEKVLVTEGYDTTYCNTCGKAFTGPTQVHDCGVHLVFDDHAGYHTRYTPPVYETVEHPAVTHVVHHPAQGC